MVSDRKWKPQPEDKRWQIEEPRAEKNSPSPTKDGIKHKLPAAMTIHVMAHSATFKKKERLSAKKRIDRLFEAGESIRQNPFKVLFSFSKNLDTVQILISIPKKNFRKASARNLLKRKVREAYRRNKHILPENSIQKPVIAYIYLATEILPYTNIEEAIKVSLEKIGKRMTKIV